MEPDLTTSALNWTDLTGTILPGGYELKELLEADDAEAQFRARVLGDRDLDAIAQFVQASPQETGKLVAGWELMRELRHANLTIPLGAGSWDRDGIELGYLVLRRADESLDGVLKERALTAAETTEVVLSITKALEVLHLNGLVHGALSPEQVLAVGDRIQLSVTGIRHAGSEPEIALVLPKYLAPESAYPGADEDDDDGENLSPASDIWCLGTTIFEALTQKDWSEESREETAALPEPFATIALRCLEEKPENRCKLPEAIALLKGEIKPAPRAKAAAAAASATAPVVIAPPPLAGQTEEKKSVANGTAPIARNLAPAPIVPSKLDVQHGGPAVAKPQPQNVPPPPQSAGRSAAAVAPQKSVPPTPKSSVASKTGTASGIVRNVPTAKSSTPPPVRPLPVAPGAFSRRWIWAAAALVFVFFLVWIFRPSRESGSSVVTTKPAVPVTQTPPAADNSSAAVPAPRTSQAARTPDTARAGETKVLRPDGTASRETAPPPAATSPVPSARSLGTSAHGDIWHVILYTYARREDAQHMAQTLNKRHSDLGAEVFSREDNQGPYLVTAGGGMTKVAATDTRRKAVGLGLPRDTYIQNFPK